MVKYKTETARNRSFVIDEKLNQFRMDGQPFRIISGEFHYFRAHHETWSRKLRLMRAAGLNSVSTYVEWSLHNPQEGVYNWKEIADIERFISLARTEKLYIVLRVGPFIDADRDNGGLPYWLIRNYPSSPMRSTDKSYMRQVDLWLSQLMRRIRPSLYGNGGNVIMIQIENHYGAHPSCDRQYTEYLRNLFQKHVNDKAVLFTVDNHDNLRCGKITDVLATLSFYPSADIQLGWQNLKRYQNSGPLVCTEYFTGQRTCWQETFATMCTTSVTSTLRKLLQNNVNINFYMFCGGSNFGFTSGARASGAGKYSPIITSYDFDAPMDEAGNPNSKYRAIREMIGKYNQLPDISIPDRVYKAQYGRLKLQSCCVLLSQSSLKVLSDGQKYAKQPLTFEALDQNSGLVLYETDLPTKRNDPSLLEVPGICDRGYVYMNRKRVGILSRQTCVYSLPIDAQPGNRLQILVENQGRISPRGPTDFKGIIGDVLLDKQPLYSWYMTKYSLEYSKLEKLTGKLARNKALPSPLRIKNMLRTGPVILRGTLRINSREPYDTYLNTTGWGKGVVFLNGFNLGRYWPANGPQMTLYVPKEILQVGSNNIIMVEYQSGPKTEDIAFVDKPIYV